MFNLIRNNPRAFLIACVIHLVLIAILSANVAWHQQTAPPKQTVVQSVLIDDAKFKAEAQKQKRVEEEKQRQAQELKRKQDEEQRRLEEKNKQEADKKRLAEQEKQKQAEALKRKQAEEKNKQEAEKKRLAEAKRKEAERKQAEEKKKQEAEKKRLAEAERKRKIEAEEKRKAEEEVRRKAEEEAARRAEEQRLLQEQMAAEEERLEAIRLSAMEAEIARYKILIEQKVNRNWNRPPDWPSGTKCDVNVRLIPGPSGGQVISAAVVRSCGQPLFDKTVVDAVNRASPLPLPSDPSLWDKFRDIEFGFSPRE